MEATVEARPQTAYLVVEANDSLTLSFRQVGLTRQNSTDQPTSKELFGEAVLFDLQMAAFYTLSFRSLLYVSWEKELSGIFFVDFLLD